MVFRRIPIVSIFSGAGGLDLGFELAGFDPVLALEENNSAVETYNWNRKRIIAHKLDLARASDADILAMLEKIAPNDVPRGLVGGPPCQSFSMGNSRRKRSDPRSKLPLHFARILKVLNTRFSLDFFAFENVVGLKAKKHRRIFAKIIGELTDAGFSVHQQELVASDYGVPQIRRRLFLVGINRRKYPNLSFAFPSPSSRVPMTTRAAIGHLPQPAFFRRDIRVDEIPHHPNHWTMNPKSQKFHNAGGNGRSFRKLDWDKPSRTVAYGNREVHLHPLGNRRVSVFEAMLLQGFPITYQLRGNLSEQVRQVSDAVPPPLAEALARAIRQQIYSRLEIVHRKLLFWFRHHARSFPWRQTRNPYRVLIAEKLLQQTAARPLTVSVYQSLIREYPDVHSLARANVRTLTKIISPLGLSYRGKEFRDLAAAISRRHGGFIPSSIPDLLKLPGIGQYIATALLSFVFSKNVAVVDTNVGRFLRRIYGMTDKIPSNPARDRKLIEMAGALIPQGRSREFNFAVLDLCAKVCLPRVPLCGACILRKECAYGRQAFVKSVVTPSE